MNAIGHIPITLYLPTVVKLVPTFPKIKSCLSLEIHFCNIVKFAFPMFLPLRFFHCIVSYLSTGEAVICAYATRRLVFMSFLETKCVQKIPQRTGLGMCIIPMLKL